MKVKYCLVMSYVSSENEDQVSARMIHKYTTMSIDLHQKNHVKVHVKENTRNLVLIKKLDIVAFSLLDSQSIEY